MKSRIVSGLNEDDTNELTAQFVHCARLRKRLTMVLEGDIDSLHTSMRNEELYDNPNWALVQADKIAQVKALKKLISLLEN